NDLWGVFRYDDILEIEKNKHVFISSDQNKGGYRPNLPADPSIIGLDDPLHAERRALVSRRFTPRAVQAWEDHVRATVDELLDEEKQRCHATDVMTVWTQSEVQGRPLTVDEVGSDCLLILDGGAETTRTVIARTMLHLVDRPDQWKLLKDGADSTIAAEEFIRYVTPIHNMCRTTTRDVTMGDVTVRAGQQVVLMYAS